MAKPAASLSNLNSPRLRVVGVLGRFNDGTARSSSKQPQPQHVGTCVRRQHDHHDHRRHGHDPSRFSPLRDLNAAYGAPSGPDFMGVLPGKLCFFCAKTCKEALLRLFRLSMFRTLASKPQDSLVSFR